MDRIMSTSIILLDQNSKQCRHNGIWTFCLVSPEASWVLGNRWHGPRVNISVYDKYSALYAFTSQIFLRIVGQTLQELRASCPCSDGFCGEADLNYDETTISVILWWVFSPEMNIKTEKLYCASTTQSVLQKIAGWKFIFLLSHLIASSPQLITSFPHKCINANGFDWNTLQKNKKSEMWKTRSRRQ